MSGSMILHCGGQRVEMDDLRKVPLPEATDTYVPVSHYDMALNIYDAAQRIVVPDGYVFMDQKLGMAREGQRVFGLLRYSNGDTDPTKSVGMSIGWRNSYDRSMSAAIAIGANVFVCDNLCISGDICRMHKHTKNVLDNMIHSIRDVLFKATAHFKGFVADMNRMKECGLSNEQGYQLLGLMAGMGILTPTLFSEAMRQWQKPEHEAFRDRSAWSLYNAVTAALKEAPPHRTLEMHRDTHGVFVAEFLPPAPRV